MGGYDTYGDPVKDNDEEEGEDYQNYMDAQRGDDPWRRSGTQKEQLDNSIGSDFDNDGKPKEDQPKAAEQTDFFGMDSSPAKQEDDFFNMPKKAESTVLPATSGFDFDFGTPAVQNKPAAATSAAFDFNMTPAPSKPQPVNNPPAGGMIFDFDAPDTSKVADPKEKSLLDIASAPQGEFDFDFATPAAPSQPAATAQTNNNGEIDLLNQPAQMSMDDLMNTKTDNQVKQEQEKTDKIQDFLNKQFSEITLK